MVTAPAAPAPSPATQTGIGTAVQTITLVVPPGGQVRLLDGVTL